MTKGRSVFSKEGRISVNTIPMVAVILLPWFMFMVALGAQSSKEHFQNVVVTVTILAVEYLVCALILGAAVITRLRHVDPTWMSLLAFSCIVWTIAGTVYGGDLYDDVGLRLYSMRDLRTLPQVDGKDVRGSAITDAGTLYFTSTTKIDGARASHFKHETTYCVAPIVTMRDGAPVTPDSGSYDLWAVGKDCCSIAGADFRCGAFSDLHARSALRVIDPSAAPFYRLAVMQAETRYRMRSSMPVFVEWVRDPLAIVQGWDDEITAAYFHAAAVSLTIHTALVCLALYMFQRIADGVRHKKLEDPTINDDA